MKKKKLTFQDHWEWLHNNPPLPFNPLYDPKASTRFRNTSNSMVADNFYATHTREECKVEWGKRYDQLKGVMV